MDSARIVAREAVVNGHLDALRRATESFRSFDAAQQANYTMLFADMCMDHATDGGMGYHYVNTTLLDTAVAVSLAHDVNAKRRVRRRRPTFVPWPR